MPAKFSLHVVCPSLLPPSSLCFCLWWFDRQQDNLKGQWRGSGVKWESGSVSTSHSSLLRVLVHGCLNGAAPGYLSDLTVSVASAARRRLRSASTSDNSSRIHRRPCVCRGRSTSVEQFTASSPLNLHIVYYL